MLLLMSEWTVSAEYVGWLKYYHPESCTNLQSIASAFSFVQPTSPLCSDVLSHDLTPSGSSYVDDSPLTFVSLPECVCRPGAVVDSPLTFVSPPGSSSVVDLPLTFVSPPGSSTGVDSPLTSRTWK